MPPSAPASVLELGAFINLPRPPSVPVAGVGLAFYLAAEGPDSSPGPVQVTVLPAGGGRGGWVYIAPHPCPHVVPGCLQPGAGVRTGLVV